MSRAPTITIDARMMRESGIGTYLRALVPRVVARLPAARFVLLVRPGEPAPDDPRVRHRVLTAGIYSPAEQIAVARATVSGTDLLWVPHINVPVAHRGRLLVTVHDCFYLVPELAAGVRLDKRLYVRWCMGRIARQADAILTVSEFTAAELRRTLGPIRGSVTVAPNAVGPEWSEPAAGPRPHAGPYVLAVGNVKPHKNLGRLLAAFRRVAPDHPHDLVVVGRAEGFTGGSGIPVADVAALGDRVRFTGAVDGATLRALYQHADALAFVSLYEGFGLPPLEAMASGTPVLASRAASIPEVCGDAALLCDPRDVGDIAAQLGRLLSDDALRAGLVDAGRHRVQAFSWDRAADTIAGVMTRLL